MANPGNVETAHQTCAQGHCHRPLAKDRRVGVEAGKKHDVKTSCANEPANSMPTTGLALAKWRLHHLLEKGGFRHIEVSVVSREKQSPHFQTVFATGVKW